VQCSFEFTIAIRNLFTLINVWQRLPLTYTGTDTMVLTGYDFVVPTYT